MEKENSLILEQAKLHYHVKSIAENTMGGSGNKVFEVQREQTPFILRASKYSPANEKHVEMELNWIDYLSSHMDGIVKPVRSVNHRLYEIVPAGGNTYILCLMEKAHGKIVDSKNPAEFNEDLYFNLGALMGSMHRLTAGYKGNIINPCFVWDNDAYSWRGNNPILDEEVRLSEQKYKDEIHALPISKDSYGIIHYDIHTDNFFVDNGRITLFDFDACQFNWYAADMASAIFFMVLKGANPLNQPNEKERTEFAESYLISYLKGYMQTNVLCEYWIDTFELFMKYQMTDEYRFAQTCLGDEMGQWYLDWHKNRIVNNLPYVSIDYKKVINSILIENGNHKTI